MKGRAPPLRYNSFNRYLRRRYGGPVRKIPLDGGFGCPHRGGEDGRQAGGCIYCENAAFSPPSAGSPAPLREQIERGIRAGRGRRGAGSPRAFIAYFQAYTGTWGPPSLLRERYDAVRAFPEIRGLSVGTRPDCVDEPVLDLLASYASAYEVWLELGLQSASEATLRRIRRGHGVADFVQAVERAAPRGILVCAHVILGLPGEGRAEMMATAGLLASLPVHGIKIHHCHVIQGTPLGQEYAQGRYRPLEHARYRELVCDFLERIPWPVTVQRLIGEAPDELLAAPRWGVSKSVFLQGVQRELARRGSFQGARVSGRLPPSGGE